MSERDEHSQELDHRAAVADVALQDALIEDRYDGRIFAEKLRGNGYEVVPVEEIERMREALALAETIIRQLPQNGKNWNTISRFWAALPVALKAPTP